MTLGERCDRVIEMIDRILDDPPPGFRGRPDASGQDAYETAAVPGHWGTIEGTPR